MLQHCCCFFGMLLVPDTPNSLAERGRPDQARRVLERIRGTSKVDVEMKSIVAAVEKGNKVADVMTSLSCHAHHGSRARENRRNLLSLSKRCQLVLHALNLYIAGI